MSIERFQMSRKDSTSDTGLGRQAIRSATSLALPIGMDRNACINFCSNRVFQIESDCSKGNSPQDMCDAFDGRAFMNGCATQFCAFTPPTNYFGSQDPERLLRIGTEIARRHLGSEYQAIATEAVHGPENETMAYIVTATREPEYKTDPSAWQKLSARLRQVPPGEESKWYDDNMGYVVLGNQAHIPPVIGAGMGLSSTFHSLNKARKKLIGQYGGDNNSYTYVKAHSDPFFPVLEFTRSGSSYFYSMPTGKISRRFELRRNAPSTKSEPLRAERAYQWFTFINR